MSTVRKSSIFKALSIIEFLTNIIMMEVHTFIHKDKVELNEAQN